MEASSMTSLCKLVLYTNNKTVFDSFLKQNGVEYDEIELLWSVYKLFLYTDYFPVDVRLYFSSEITYGILADKMGVSESTIKTKVKRQCDSFTKRLGTDVWVRISSKTLSKEEINSTYNIVQELIKRSNVLVGKLTDIFTVDILDCIDFNAEYAPLTDSGFDDLKAKFRYFSAPAITHMAMNMDDNLMRHGIRLLTSKDSELNEPDQRRKRVLELFMMIKKD